MAARVGLQSPGLRLATIGVGRRSCGGRAAPAYRWATKQVSAAPPLIRHLHTSRIQRDDAQRQSTTGAATTSTSTTATATTSASPDVATATSNPDILAMYTAPLAKMFFRIKIFSLASLTTAIAFTPALLMSPGNMSTAGRVSLVATALLTSSGSTAIVAWIGKPYVGVMQLLNAQKTREMLRRDVYDDISGSAGGGGSTQQNYAAAAASAIGEGSSTRPALLMESRNWRLRRLQTAIYHPELIRPTSRPLATWELTAAPPALSAPDSDTGAYVEQRSVVKLVAATRDLKTGKLLGRWWATWPSQFKAGQCTEEGKVLRHFTVHEELLDDEWRVL